MTPHMVRNLGGFQNRVAWHIMGKKHWRSPYAIWDYPPLEEEMRQVGLEEVEAYVLRSKNTIVKYISMI